MSSSANLLPTQHQTRTDLQPRKQHPETTKYVTDRNEAVLLIALTELHLNLNLNNTVLWHNNVLYVILVISKKLYKVGA